MRNVVWQSTVANTPPFGALWFVVITLLCIASHADETAVQVVVEDDAAIVEPADDSSSSSQTDSQQQVTADSSDSDVIHTDAIEDSLFDPLQADPDCNNATAEDCWVPPVSTVESWVIDATCSYGGQDPDEQECQESVVVDKHWGSDPNILRMRDQLRQTGSGTSGRRKHQARENRRPPIFLIPGLASTRLVAWKYKACPHHPLLSDIKVQDNVWLNINLLFQMSTIDVNCFKECLQLGWNQTDTDDAEIGCKLRPDEGLDAISSLSPGGIGSQLLVGGTNTVYAWLIQWLADNLGYDVSNIVGLPYDWRLSPDKMEQRDGFLTLTRRRMEAAVQSNGKPGIVVAHSMGNVIFRYFLEWLRSELRSEAYEGYLKQATRRAKAMQERGGHLTTSMMEGETSSYSSLLPGWMQGVVSGEWWWTATAAAGGTMSQQPSANDESALRDQLWELAKLEGDANWYEWIEKHIWTYVGLSAPLLGAVNPLRAVISGENMGMPMTDEAARVMELTFGSTHTVNPISSKQGFCDQWETDQWDEEPPPDESAKANYLDSRLACLDDILTDIEVSRDKSPGRDPWGNFPALKNLLYERSDWDSDFPMIQVVMEICEENERTPCVRNETLALGPMHAQTGELFERFNEIWKEQDEPLVIKRDQLKESFWDTKVKNVLNRTWDRPLIKHIIMAYGVDIPTEAGYVYRKKADDKNKNEEFDGIPNIESVLWETEGGRIDEEKLEVRGSITDILLLKKKPKRVPLRNGRHRHSGDGSVPYLSLSWAHTWLLHAARAKRHSASTDELGNPLDDISISHRPKGAMEWKEGPPPPRIILVGQQDESEKDTGTNHPHGTKYKPEMIRYYSTGKSRTTGMEYTTTVIEAIGVEHKETTRNYDILAAVFTDALKFMHDDLDML